MNACLSLHLVRDFRPTHTVKVFELHDGKKWKEIYRFQTHIPDKANKVFAEWKSQIKNAQVGYKLCFYLRVGFFKTVEVESYTN